MFAGLLWHGMFIVTSSIIVSFGTADSMPRPADENSEKVPGRLLMWASLIITTLVAASYSTSHYSST